MEIHRSHSGFLGWIFYRSVWFFVVLVLVVFVIFFANATWFTNSPWIKVPLLQLVEDQLGQDIQVKTLTLDFFPNLRIDLIGLEIEQQPIDQFSFRASHLDIELPWQPLLFERTLVIHHAVIEQPDIIYRIKAEKESGGSLFGFLPEIRHLDISDGRFTFLKDSNSGPASAIAWENINLTISGSNGKLPIHVRVSGSHAHPDQESSFSFSGILDQSAGSINVSPSTQWPSVQLTGQVEVNNLDLGHVSEFLDLGSLDHTNNHRAHFQTGFSFFPDKGDYSLVFSNFKTSLNSVTFQGKASLSRLLAESPVFFLTGFSDPVSLSDFKGLLPKGWLPKGVESFLTDHQIGGIVEVTTATAAGSLTAQTPISAVGMIQLREGTIRPDPDHTPLQNVDATVIVESNLENILEFNGGFEFSPASGNESTDHFGKTGPWIRIQAQAELPAREVVSRVTRDVSFKKTAGSFLDLLSGEGVASLDMKIQGSAADSSKFRILEGILITRDIGLRSPRYALPFQAGSGHIVLNRDEVVIQKVNGLLGQSAVEILGGVSLGEGSEFNNLTIRTKFEATDLKTLIPGFFQNGTMSEGPVDVVFTLSGPTSEPTIHGRMDLTGLKVSYLDVFQKPSNIPARAEWEGRITNDRKFSIDRGVLAIPPFRLNWSGELSLDNPDSFKLHLLTESEEATLFPQEVFVGVKDFRIHNLDVNMKIEGHGLDWTGWTANGSVKVTHPGKGLAEPPESGPPALSIQLTQGDQEVNTKFQGEGIPLELIIPKEDGKDTKINGTLSTSASLEANISDSQGLKQSLMGHGEIQITDGRILHSVVLSQIMGLLNVPNLLLGKINLFDEGFPFDHITGTIMAERGLLTSTDLVLNSPVLKLTAAGSYDLPANQVDFVAAVSPFGAYSNLLKSIPLFGNILKGDRKGLMTALFEIKGSLDHPEVRYLPLESFTEGAKGFAQLAVDVLTNTVNLPVSGIEDSSSHPPTP